VAADRLRAIARAEVLDATDDLLICKWHRRHNGCFGIRHLVQHSSHAIDYLGLHHGTDCCS
jgi:hypothetical protein